MSHGGEQGNFLINELFIGALNNKEPLDGVVVGIGLGGITADPLHGSIPVQQANLCAFGQQPNGGSLGDSIRKIDSS